MSVKYILGAIFSIPLLPILYIQGKKIREQIPQLPEAEGTKGEIGEHRNQVQLITIGESTIAGVGVSTHEQGFTGSLATTLAQELDLSVKWSVYAKSGYTTKRVTKKILPKIEEKKVDIIVVGLGGNDAFALKRPSDWRKEIRNLIENVRSKFNETPIVFTNMPPIKEFPAFTSLMKFVIGNLVELLGDELKKEVVNHPNVYYNHSSITLEDWMERNGISGQPSDFFSDGIHPSKLTYRIWGKEMAYFITENEILT